MLTQLANILVPIGLITLIGYLMGRSKLGFGTKTLSRLVVTVATPSLIFHTLTSIGVPTETLRDMSTAALICVAVATVMGLAALLVSGGHIRSFLPPLVLPNSGNMGLPLVVLAFGDEGLQLGIAYFFVIAIVQHTVGLAIYAGVFRPRQILSQPLVFAVAAVLLVMWSGVQVPQIVLVTTEILGGMMIPAMLILLGASLSTLEVKDLRPALLVAAGRLVIGVLSAVSVIMLLDLQGVKAGTVFLLATMPTAIMSYVLAERYQMNAQQVAGSVVVSTVLTFVCLPVLVWLALKMV